MIRLEDFRLLQKILNAKLDKNPKIELRWFDDVQTDKKYELRVRCTDS